MSRLKLMYVFTFFVSTLFSQTITPSVDTEFCPLQDITFTVSVIGTNVVSVSSKNINVAPFVVSQPFDINKSNGIVTFKFVGRFMDNNNKQTFSVNYMDSYGQATSYDFTFKLIKSLFWTTSLNTTPKSITAKRCESSVFNISFPNLQFTNSFVSPAISYGLITSYNYLIPKNWKLGTTVSDGQSWIIGTNNVNITSDYSTGDGQSIQIKPINSTCGMANLCTGQVTSISVNRPAPDIKINESDNDICAGSKIYTLTGLPTGAITSWSIVDYYNCCTKTNETNSSVQINKTNGNGIVTLTATVSHCTFTYSVSKVLNIGTPISTYEVFSYLPLNATCYEVNAFYVFRPSLLSGNYASEYQWSYCMSGSGSETQITSSGEDGVFCFMDPGIYDVIVRPKNSCGLGAPSIKTIEVGWGCTSSPFSLITSPNPANDKIEVSLADNNLKHNENNKKDEKIKCELFSISTGGVVKQWFFDSNSNVKQVSIADVKEGAYILVVEKGLYKQRSKVIIKR